MPAAGDLQSGFYKIEVLPFLKAPQDPGCTHSSNSAESGFQSREQLEQLGQDGCLVEKAVSVNISLAVQMESPNLTRTKTKPNLNKRKVRFFDTDLCDSDSDIDEENMAVVQVEDVQVDNVAEGPVEDTATKDISHFMENSEVPLTSESLTSINSEPFDNSYTVNTEQEMEQPGDMELEDWSPASRRRRGKGHRGHGGTQRGGCKSNRGFDKK